MLSLNERTPSFCNDSKPNAYNKDWMKKISNSRLVTQMSIPGTHDSSARHGGILAQDQSWTILDQLYAGIRFLDMRCRIVEDVFMMYHGPIDQKISFGEVLNQFEQFLKENPSEWIMIRLKQEEKPILPKADFSTIFNTYSDAFPKLFLMSKDFPKVSQLRSKVWVIKEDNLSFDTKSFYSFTIQDDYDLNTRSVEYKKTVISEFLQIANDLDSEDIAVNHCSGYGLLGKEPVYVAQKTNQVVFDSESFTKIGIIMMDFPGEALIKYIISKNFS